MKGLITACFLAGAGTLVCGAETLSLDSCRQMALSNNKAIRIAEENIRGAEYSRKAAKGAYFPGIDFSGGYMYNQRQIELLGEDAKLPTMSFDPATQSYNYNVVKTPDGTPVINPENGMPIPTQVAVIPKEAMSYDVHNVFAGAFTLTQPVFMGGQIRALNKIAEYSGEMAVNLRDKVRQDVVYTVDEAYWMVVSLGEKKKLAESFCQLVDSLRRNVGIMLDEGVATRSDVLTVDVKYNEAQIALTKVNNGLTLSKMNLAQICGMQIDGDFTLEDESLDNDGATAPAYTYTMEDVYANRSDLKAIRSGISILQHREKLTMGSMLPKVALVGAYTFSNPNVIHGFEKKFGGGFSVGATLTIPLWHWGVNYNRYRAAKSATAASRLALEEMEEKVSLQVSQAKFSFQEAYKTYDMTVTNLEKADENLRQAELAFKEGVMTADDVIGAQTAWLKANSEKIDAEIGIRLCEVYLSKVLGQMKY